MNRFSFLTVAMLGMCIAQAGFAQTETGSTASGSILTGSGSIPTTRDILAEIRTLIPHRTPKKLSDVIVPVAKQTAWVEESANQRERMWEHRTECREAIRRANRDQLMDRVLQCQRGDLLLDVTLLRKQMQYISLIPLLQPAIRSSATGAIIKLMDADMAIVNAIDAGLFETVEHLQEAKRNLRTSYREPYWRAQFSILADRELTWITFMVKNLEERTTVEERTDAIGILQSDAAVCLRNAAQTVLSSLEAPEISLAMQKLAVGRIELQNCLITFKKMALKERQEEVETLEEGAAQQ